MANKICNKCNHWQVEHKKNGCQAAECQCDAFEAITDPEDPRLADETMADRLDEAEANVFDPELFKAAPDPETFQKLDCDNSESEESEPIEMCPYYPKGCEKAGTSFCDGDCEHNPDNFMDPEIKKVFDVEPWSNYCFTCGEFVASRAHGNVIEKPDPVGSHIVATGYTEYRTKLSKWMIERMTGKDDRQ